MRNFIAETADTAHPLADRPDNEFTVRVASALVLGGLVIAVMIAGSPYFESLVVLAAALMGREWSALTGVAPGAWPMLILMLGPALIAVGLTGGVWMETVLFALVAPVLLIMAFAGRDTRLGFWLAAGFAYIALPVGALIWLRGLEDGLLLLAWLFAVVWTADIGAYAVGRLVGGAKLAPRVSPNKTWAGLIGGVLLAGAAGGVFAWWLMPGMSLELRIAAALFIGLAAQGGDLAESGLKRRFGVKDTGTLIPGHGGVLDRVDGLVVAAPVAASFEFLRLAAMA